MAIQSTMRPSSARRQSADDEPAIIQVYLDELSSPDSSTSESQLLLQRHPDLAGTSELNGHAGQTTDDALLQQQTITLCPKVGTSPPQQKVTTGLRCREHLYIMYAELSHAASALQR